MSWIGNFCLKLWVSQTLWMLSQHQKRILILLIKMRAFIEHFSMTGNINGISVLGESHNHCIYLPCEKTWALKQQSSTVTQATQQQSQVPFPFHFGNLFVSLAHLSKYILMPHTHSCTHMSTHIHLHTCTHVLTHTYMHSYIPTCTLSLTHTGINIFKWRCRDGLVRALKCANIWK